MKKIYGCWIPMLSGYIDYGGVLEKQKTRSHAQRSSEGSYFIDKNISDTEPKEVTRFQVTYDGLTGKIRSVKMRIKGYEYKSDILLIHDHGITVFSIEISPVDGTAPSDTWMSKECDIGALQLYKIIKNAYHHHMHHEKDPDAELRPIELTDISIDNMVPPNSLLIESIYQKVFDQYKNIVIQYQALISGMSEELLVERWKWWERITSSNVLSIFRSLGVFRSLATYIGYLYVYSLNTLPEYNDIIKYLRTVLGHMIYARSLIDLYDHNDERRQLLTDITIRSTDSFELLCNNHTWHFALGVTIWATALGAVLAMIGIVLSMVSILPPILSKLENVLR